MKKIILFIIITLISSYANQYDIYDINGKKTGSFNGILNKSSIIKFAKENQGSVLVKKNSENEKNKSTRALSQKQLSHIQSAQIQKIFEMKKDSLNNNQWFEVEKNEIVKICLDNRVFAWETSINSKIINDSCLLFQAPTLIGVDTLKVFFRDNNVSHKINISTGMKYLNFKNEKVLLGFNEYTTFEEESFKNEDPEREVSITGTYLIDKYPVTNCEFTQLMWDSIPEKATYEDVRIKKYHAKWYSRKKNTIRNENCDIHDTAANMISVLQAMKYANARSTKEGLKPYYSFQSYDAYTNYTAINQIIQPATSTDKNQILSDGYIIDYWDFKDYGTKVSDIDGFYYLDSYIRIKIDKTSDGYRLPYYDEWMIFARGGDQKNKAPWGDSSTTFKEFSKYIKFSTNPHEYDDTEPVGQMQSNGYGLYDMFGLVWEHVLLKKYLTYNYNYVSCMKGGGYHITTNRYEESSSTPFWNKLNYGYYRTGGSLLAGFRLIRNIGNNAKWTEVKSDKE